MNSWLCVAAMYIFLSPIAYDLLTVCYVSDYVTQTTLQTRRKYSLLDTRGSVSETSFFLRRKSKKLTHLEHEPFNFYGFQNKLKPLSVWACYLPLYLWG